MSPKEEIEKLKEEAFSLDDDPDCVDVRKGLVEAIIHRAVSLGGKFVRDRVEAVYSKERGACICESDEEDCVDCRPYSISSDAASQALSELEKKV